MLVGSAWIFLYYTLCLNKTMVCEDTIFCIYKIREQFLLYKTEFAPQIVLNIGEHYTIIIL